MRDAESAITSPFYDHEQELALDRESRADDWGADSVFEGHPRRRFGRRSAAGDASVRRHAGARPARPAQPERRSSGPAAPPVSARVDAAPPAAADAEPAGPSPAAADYLTHGIEWSEPPAARPAAAPDPSPAPAPAGRRTVVVTGRPGAVRAPGTGRPLAVDRRRPRPRAVDRFGARPDQVAGWAFALGMLLILIAVGTADAAAL